MHLVELPSFRHRAFEHLLFIKDQMQKRSLKSVDIVNTLILFFFFNRNRISIDFYHRLVDPE